MTFLSKFLFLQNSENLFQDAQYFSDSEHHLISGSGGGMGSHHRQDMRRMRNRTLTGLETMRLVEQLRPGKAVFVVYFDQLLGAARTQKLVKILFFRRFQPFLFISNLFQ